MGPDMIVLLEPFIYDCLSLSDCREPLCIEDFSSKCAVKPFVVAVLPGAARSDLDRLYTNLLQPYLKFSGDKL